MVSNCGSCRSNAKSVGTFATYVLSASSWVSGTMLTHLHLHRDVTDDRRVKLDFGIAHATLGLSAAFLFNQLENRGPNI